MGGGSKEGMGKGQGVKEVFLLEKNVNGGIFTKELWSFN